MSPKPTKTQGLRISICSTTCSSNGELSAGSAYSTPDYAASSVGSVKDEPYTPSFLTSSDDNDDNGDSADTENSPQSEPKAEPKAEDGASSSQILVPPPTVKRGRGRPRKNPPNPPETKTKVAKGRSKTGCLTCRKRKKKCDEGKPECNNCGKNGYICEGYNPKTLWRSGRESNHRLPPFRPNLPALIEGVESEFDRKLLDHFVVTVSSVLSQFGDEKNPFKEILLPLAIDNSGLMHALLCLAASHMARTDPTGYAKNAQYHHKDEAIKILSNGLANLQIQEGSVIDDHLVATTIVLCLEATCEGDNTGVHGQHIGALSSMVQAKINGAAGKGDTEPHKIQFAQFFLEFFRYHVVLDGVTSMVRRPPLDLNDLVMAPFMQLEAGTLIGILDQLFLNISRITKLRDVIRKRKSDGIYPTIDEVMLSQAVEIDEQVRTWKPAQSTSQPYRYFYALLYQQVTWIYLYRTVQRSIPDLKIRTAVDEGLKCLSSLPTDEYSYSVLLLPVFLLGCAAFDAEQRPEIRKRLDEMRSSGLQNAAHAQIVLNKIWELMDDDDETSWDWEKIIQDLGYDFLLS